METQEINKDLLELDTYYNRAKWGKRLANYLIDYLIFFILFTGICVLLTVFIPAFDDLADSSGFSIILVLCYALYMSLLETIFKGRSFGKLITKTRAVNADGTDISVGTAFARGFIRIVPFAPLSALGTPCNPWQDRWTNTIVIDEQNTVLG